MMLFSITTWRSMAERLSFKQRCNAFVRAKEETDLEEMCFEAIDKHIRAEGCGCPACGKQSEAAKDRFVQENWRVNVWSPDQEEEMITNLALQKVEDDNGD